LHTDTPIGVPSRVRPAYKGNSKLHTDTAAEHPRGDPPFLQGSRIREPPEATVRGARLVTRADVPATASHPWDAVRTPALSIQRAPCACKADRQLQRLYRRRQAGSEALRQLRYPQTRPVDTDETDPMAQRFGSAGPQAWSGLSTAPREYASAQCSNHLRTPSLPPPAYATRAAR